MSSKTLFGKIWDSHVIEALGGDRYLVHIDRHMVHEGTSRQAFDGLREKGRKVHSLGLTFGVVDHDPSTLPGRRWDSFEPARERIQAMMENCEATGVELFQLDDPRQGIVHVIAPELGIALPGATLVCGDSHTATCGGAGAWAWGIGTTEVERVLTTQTLIQRKPPTMRINFEGKLQDGVYSKDLVLHLIGKFGTAGGTGFAVEYAGPAIRALPVEARFTICNMSIEFGARSGLIAPDDLTYQYLAGRRYAPQGALWDQALAYWKTLPSAPDAVFDRELDVDCSKVTPQITWGTSPQDVVGIDEPVPTADRLPVERRETLDAALAYMDLRPGVMLEGLPIDYAFIGSCTNSRLSDLEIAAKVVRGRKVPESITALAVPGSTQVKVMAEAAGLDKIFIEAGFQWRESGCSMCQTLGGDFVAPKKRCIATSNRNFEGRQGPQARTHLASPAMVAAAAVNGHITDVRKLGA